MISLARDRAAIPQAFLDPDREANLIELFRARQNGSHSQSALKKRLEASSRWSGAKPQLLAESHGKCAFCEAPVDGVYYGDVEHYRPKAIYWWLIYCYDNYLYSCRLCNGKKSDQFKSEKNRIAGPQFGAAATDAELLAIARTFSPVPSDNAAIANFVQLYAGEEASLPNPYTENPEPLFRWVPDKILREVRIAPASNSRRARTAFEAAEQILDLNRAALLSQRYVCFEGFARIRNRFGRGDADDKSFYREWAGELCEAQKPFAAMARYFFREWQILS